MNTETKRPWIDDTKKQELKHSTDFLDLLRSFGLTEIKPTSNANQFKAKCLFSDCNSKTGDYPFGINTEKNVFNCFHCGRHGDILELIKIVKGLNFYGAKQFLLEWNRGRVVSSINSPTAHESPPPVSSMPSSPKIAYRPFKRRLTGLRVREIPDLENKGLTSETAERFGVGYCSQGMMKGRLVVPVYESCVAGAEDENILAYAGYSLTQKQKEYGDWKFPDGFEKGKELFNLNRVIEETKHAQEILERHGVIVVESFWNVLKLSQAGINNVVALMGTALTEEQEKLLLSVTDKVKLWLDGDEAGVKALNNILRTKKQGGNNGLIYKAHVKIISPEVGLVSAPVGERVKPYHFTENEIKEILKN